MGAQSPNGFWYILSIIFTAIWEPTSKGREKGWEEGNERREEGRGPNQTFATFCYATGQS